jgi:hypothetical protein
MIALGWADRPAFHDNTWGARNFPKKKSFIKSSPSPKIQTYFGKDSRLRVLFMGEPGIGGGFGRPTTGRNTGWSFMGRSKA